MQHLMDNKDDGKKDRPAKSVHPNSMMHNNWAIGEDAAFGESSWKSVSRASYNQSSTGAPPTRPTPAYEPGQGNRSRDLFGAGNNKGGTNAFSGNPNDRFQSHSNSMHSAEHSVQGQTYHRTEMVKTASRPSTIGDTINNTSGGIGTRSFTTSTMDATRAPTSAANGQPSGPSFPDRTDLGYNFAGLAFDGRVVERTRRPGAKLNFDRCAKTEDPNMRYNIISGRDEVLFKAPLPDKYENKRPPLNSLGALRPYMDGDERLTEHLEKDWKAGPSAPADHLGGGGGGGAPILTEDEMIAMAHARVAAKMQREEKMDIDSRLEREVEQPQTRYG
jgi:hypothetical protein